MEEFMSNNTAFDSAGQRSHCMFADGRPFYSGYSSGYVGDYSESALSRAPHAFYRPDTYFKRSSPGTSARQQLPSYGVTSCTNSEALFSATVAVAAGEHSGAAGYA